MSPDRQLIVSIATSADGYIARPDGDVAWLDRPTQRGDHGMRAFYRIIDTIVLGRATYDKALAFFNAQGGGFDPTRHHYVFTRRPHRSSLPAVTFVSEPVRRFARRIRRQPGRNVWLMGGAGLIGSFLDAGEIDAFIIHVIPVFIGQGIPLIAPASRDVFLTLQSTRRFRDGVVRLHYRVSPRKAPRRASPER